MSETHNLRVVVIGRVQGVGYRQFVLSEATKLGLVGWVRNDRTNRDRVELEVEGPRDALELLVQKLHVGPFGARVQNVAVQWGDVRGNLHSFEIRY